jgi:hypothetical protein
LIDHVNKSPDNHSLIVYIVMVITLLILSILTWAGVYPMEVLAAAASADGVIEESFSALLRSSQLLLCLSLLLAAVFAPWILRAHVFMRNSIQAAGTARFLVLSSLAAFLWATFLHLFLFDGIPHVTDEISHLFQSKILLTGRLFAVAPPCPELFIQHHIYITTEGKWFSIYPPGHSTLLAIMGVIGIKGLLSPICFAVSTAAVGWLAHQFMPVWTARRLVLLFVLSPLNWLLGGSFMSHFTFMAFFTVGLVFFTLLARPAIKSTARFAHGLLAGIFLGYSSLIRPQDVVLATAMTGVVVLIISPRAIPRLLVRSVWLFPGLMLPVLYLLIWNHFQYGTSLALGYAHSVETVNHMLKPRFGFSESFGPMESIHITAWTLLRMNKVLLGWPTAFLILPFALWPGRTDRRAVAAMVAASLVVGFYFFYFYHGTEYEARFYHVAVPTLLYLVIRGIDHFSELINFRPPSGHNVCVLVIAACWLHAGIYYLPVYLWPKYGNGYEQSTPVLRDVVRKAEIQNAVVLVSSDGENSFRYSSGFMWNDPGLTDSIIYARDPGTFPSCLAEAFPDRNIYRFIPEPNWKTGRLERVK